MGSVWAIRGWRYLWAMRLERDNRDLRVIEAVRGRGGAYIAVQRTHVAEIIQGEGGPQGKQRAQDRTPRKYHFRTSLQRCPPKDMSMNGWTEKLQELAGTRGRRG